MTPALKPCIRNIFDASEVAAAEVKQSDSKRINKSNDLRRDLPRSNSAQDFSPGALRFGVER